MGIQPFTREHGRLTNTPDIEDKVPESVKTGIRFVYVEDVREVLHEVFRDTPVAERWRETLPVPPSQDA